MKLRQLMLLMVGMTLLSLPFSLPACEQKPEKTDGQEAKNDGKDADKPPAKKADQPEEKKQAPGDGKEQPVGEFRLPDDPGGKLVARVVAPPERTFAKERTGPRRKPSPRHIENPLTPLPPQVASLPRLSDGRSRKPTYPTLLSPEPLFGLDAIIGALPEVLTFPAQERVRIPSPDVTQPVPLPRLARPLADRAALTDPTTDASKTAALSAPLPARTTPAPFQRFTLPDPFENHDTVKLKGPPDEESLPDSATRLPRK